jgi:hypothetical protein
MEKDHLELMEHFCKEKKGRSWLKSREMNVGQSNAWELLLNSHFRSKKGSCGKFWKRKQAKKERQMMFKDIIKYKQKEEEEIQLQGCEVFKS